MIPQNNLLEELLLPLTTKGSALNFPKVVEQYSLEYEKQIRESIKEYIEEMDCKFRNRKGRTKRYYVSSTSKRTIICMYGEITYKRTIYKDLVNGSYYCYTDEKLGIGKYHRYTNDDTAPLEAELLLLKIRSHPGPRFYRCYRHLRSI